MTRVSYREIPQAVRDLSEGRIEVLAVALPTMKAALDAGMIRLIAVNASTRLASEPGVPTVAESGWPDLTVDSPQGLFADRRADAVLRTRIAADVSEAVMDAGVATRLAQLGFSVHASTPEAFAAAIARQKRQLEVMTRISARNDVGAQR